VAYASPGAYPARLAEFAYQTDLAGQAIAVVRLYPVQYVPVEQKLRFYTSISFVIQGPDGYEYGDYLSAHISERGRRDYERMVMDMVINPADVELRPSEDPPPQTRGVDSGSYDYVIITRADWIDDFQPLADWKTRKGTPATIVNRNWIYSEYSGSDNPERIRAFVQDAQSAWGTTHFLLGGDTNTIPYHTRSINGEDIPNDTYYSDYDVDWTCEVHVGRASVGGTAAIDDFIDKVLIYEQNPPLNDYAKTATFLGFDLYANGSAEGESCKEDIENSYLPADWTYRSEYDSEGGNHRADSLAYLNAGNNLANHIDHCNTTVMGVGSVNSGEHLYNADMSGLDNGDRQSILYSIGCWPCNYPHDTCIAEAFVRSTSGGGVAFVGNSRSGWYNPYADDTLSLRYDRFFFRSLFLFDNYRLGDCFSHHKNEAYQSSTLMRYIFTELTLLGDPDLSIWTDDPQTLTASHDATLPLGPSALTVHVEDASGDLEDATVCLWKGDQVYLIDTTDAYGDASFALTIPTDGTLQVTATKRNYKPYLGSVDVGYVLTVNVVGSGWVERWPDEPVYPYDELVVLTAHADAGWVFDHWSGDLDGSDSPKAITIDGDKIVTAHFAAGPPADCPEDLVIDGRIGLDDLSELLGAYGSGPGDANWNPHADFDDSGVVDLPDLSQLLSVYGQDCPTR
jgi:hypothetical protein